MNTFIVWEAKTENFWDAPAIHAPTVLAAANEWLTPEREHEHLSIVLRLCCPKDDYRQWSFTWYRGAADRGWSHRIEEMKPIAWVGHCVLDQTLGILGSDGFDISHKDARFFSTEQEARTELQRLREEQRTWFRSKGWKHSDDDLDVFEDPVPVYEEDEFRRRPDTW